jgi:hypothetical protein
MAIELPKNEGLELLQATAHPVIDIVVDEYGYIHYERDGADDIILGSSQAQSRYECAYRADAVCAEMKLDDPIDGTLPTSRVNSKLNFRTFYEKSCEAILKSKENQGIFDQKVLALHRKEGDWDWHAPRIV